VVGVLGLQIKIGSSSGSLEELLPINTEGSLSVSPGKRLKRETEAASNVLKREAPGSGGEGRADGGERAYLESSKREFL